MKKLLSLIIGFVVVGIAQAQTIQTMLLKNGSVLHGYVEQAMDGMLLFHTDSAMIIVENKNVEYQETYCNASSLESSWLKWAEKNDMLEGAGSTRRLRLEDIIIRGASDNMVLDSAAVADDAENFNAAIEKKRHITHVRVLEKGIKVKYLELTPNSYTMSWNDVSIIKTKRRAKAMLSGIDCTYQLRNGLTYDGQPADETMNTLSLYMKGDVMQTFDINDVVKYTYHPLNTEQNIFEQSELLDIVEKNSGQEVKGIIIEQNYSSNKDEENYILIQQESGAIQSIKMSDYKGNRKERNEKYSPLYDIKLQEGEVAVNGNKMRFVNVKEEKDMVVLDSICATNIVERSKIGSTKVVVQYRLAANNNVEVYQLVKLTKSMVKKRGSVYGFSYRSLADATCRAINVKTSTNGVTTAEYIVNGDAPVALYDAIKKRAIPITIK